MSEKAGADYERSDIDPAVVGWIALGLALFVLAVPLLVPLAFPQSIERANPPAGPALSAAAPPLEMNPFDDLQGQRQADGQLSGTYGWTDRDRKIARIPVARAAERLLRTGRPGWPSP